MKSNVSNHLELAYCIYSDAVAKCTADVSDVRDLETIRSRVEREGISFLTITLPSFAKDFDRCLAKGTIDSTDFRSFRKYGAIPAFLRGMLSHVFDHETGRLYDKTSAVFSDRSSCIDGVRQICLAFKKLELECTRERVSQSLAEFVKIEHDLEAYCPPATDHERFTRVSSVLWDPILADLRLDMLVPRHGPGATAERISGNQKFSWRLWHERLELFFPFLGHAYSVSAAGEEEFEIVTFVGPEQEQPVRVTPVPKTLKGPRIIAIEPVCMQYAQQAVRSTLYARLESHRLTKGHVNFRDQSINQQLALMASEEGQLATIDLSEASDRVPRDLALSMFDGNPDLRDFIDACRSTRAEMPDGTVIGPLRKFASMGSALCFPVESMYFYTICIGALLEANHLPVTRENVFNVSRGVYVYGDDIIVPSANAEAVLDHLQKYNCKVNTNKSFWTGRFRESCGVDAFEGHVVTPVYVRQDVPQGRRQVRRLLSWIKTANLFLKKGYVRSASYMFDMCEKHLGSLPYVPPDSPALGRESFPLSSPSPLRYNQKLQRREFRAWVAAPVYRDDTLEGHAALMKCLLRLEGRLTSPSNASDTLHSDKYLEHLDTWLGILPGNRDHLNRTARYGAVALKRRWVPV